MALQLFLHFFGSLHKKVNLVTESMVDRVRQTCLKLFDTFFHFGRGLCEPFYSLCWCRSCCHCLVQERNKNYCADDGSRNIIWLGVYSVHQSLRAKRADELLHFLLMLEHRLSCSLRIQAMQISEKMFITNSSRRAHLEAMPRCFGIRIWEAPFPNILETLSEDSTRSKLED